MTVCRSCPAKITPRSKSGLCKPCAIKAMWADPHYRAKMARSNAATLAKLRENPAFVAKERDQRIAVINRVNAERRNVTPQAIARRVKTFTVTRMGWCPPHLRDDYHRLVRRKRVPAAEAREIILRQWDAELMRRRSAA